MPSTDRRSLLQYSVLTVAGLGGLVALDSGVASTDDRPSWGPPVDGAGDWAVIAEDADRYTDDRVEMSLSMTVQGPHDGSERLYDGKGLRIVSYDAGVVDDDTDWDYRFGRPRLTLRISTDSEGDSVYFSNTNAYGNTSEGRVPGRQMIRHAFKAGSGQGALNPVLHHSRERDSDGGDVTATMESVVEAPVRRSWRHGPGGWTGVGTVRCSVTEDVVFVSE